MTLPESDIQALAWALITEAQEEEEEYKDEINIDQLTNILIKHGGLVENLTMRLLFLKYYLHGCKWQKFNVIYFDLRDKHFNGFYFDIFLK